MEEESTVIIGAGAAGSYTAWRLSETTTCSVYEKSQRIGGRLYTTKLPFLPNFKFELGGMKFFKHNNPLLYSLVTKLGLPIEPVESASQETRYFYNGNYYTDIADVFNLPQSDRKYIPRCEEFLNNFKLDYEKGVDYLGLKTIEGEDVGHLSVGDYIEQRCSKPQLARNEMLELYPHFHRCSLPLIVYMLTTFTGKVGTNDPVFTMKNGMQDIPLKLLELAQQNNERCSVHLGMELTEVSYENKKFLLKFEGCHEEEPRQVSCDKLIMTIAPNAILKIKWNIDVSPIRELCVQMENMHLCKIYLVYPTPWWAEFANISNGVVYTDTAVRRTILVENWTNLETSTGEKVSIIWASYSENRGTVFKEMLKHAPVVCDRKNMQGWSQEAVTAWEELFTFLHDELKIALNVSTNDSIPEPIGGVAKLWTDETTGLHNWMNIKDYKSRQMKVMQPIPDVKLHLTGEAFPPITSQGYHTGWVEGALYSAERLLIKYFGHDPLFPDVAIE